MTDNSVTAVVAVRNGEATIRKCLQSILNQTVPISHITVVDDDSRDGTADAVNSMGSDKIELLTNPACHWVYRSRNIGASRATTFFLFFLDSDDEIGLDYVKSCFETFSKHPGAGFVYTNMVYTNGVESKKVELPYYSRKILGTKNYIPYSAMMKTSLFNRLGGYSSYLNDYRNHMTEWHLWLRMARDGVKGNRTDTYDFIYHVSPGQMSRSYERERGDMYCQLIWTMGGQINIPEAFKDPIMHVCLGQDYLDKHKVGWEVYSWRAPLSRFGSVFCFFYDIEMRYHGKETMLTMLRKAADDIKPKYIFHPTFKNEMIPVEVWETISKDHNTIGFMCDDAVRFDKFSKYYCHGFRHVVTTDEESVEKYKKEGYENVIQSQWGVNTEFHRDSEPARDIDVSFCGQNYGSRGPMLHDTRVTRFGLGQPGGMVEFSEMASIMARSKISIQLNGRPDGIIQTNARPFEVTASKAMLLAQFEPHLSDYFKNGKEMVMFRTKEEMVALIDHYLDREDERRKIAEAGYERTLRDHTWTSRLKHILNEADEGGGA